MIERAFTVEVRRARTNVFVETIAANSKDSAVALIGLRLPTENEAPAAFGDYVLALRDGLVTVPYTVFSLAAEDVDFNGIFD